MRRCRLSPPSRRRRHSEYVLVFRRAPDALDEDVVHPLARPSVEMRTPASISTPMKSALVNRLPWSVLKISGLPYLASASSTAATRNETSIVFDSRQDRSARLTQSMTAFVAGLAFAPIAETGN
jgi:hypothetical protein